MPLIHSANSYVFLPFCICCIILCNTYYNVSLHLSISIFTLFRSTRVGFQVISESLTYAQKIRPRAAFRIKVLPGSHSGPFSGGLPGDSHYLNAINHLWHTLFIYFILGGGGIRKLRLLTFDRHFLLLATTLLTKLLDDH